MLIFEKQKRKKYSLFSNRNKFLSAFTLIEILIYLGLFAIVLPILVNLLTDYFNVKNKLDLKSELRNIFLKIEKEVIQSTSLDILTDWEIVFNKKNETLAIFKTSPIYLDLNSSTVKGMATNLNIGSISFSGDNYGVFLTATSTCFITQSNSTSSIYSFSSYAWSPVIGWIEFRNNFSTEPLFGVCETTNKELVGWAWNDIIGWISFNCSDVNICQTSNYKVFENNGYFYGYAWNDNVGWIIFDGKKGSVYLAKINPNLYYLELLSDPRVFVEDLKFSYVGNSLKTDIKIKSGNYFYEQGETAIILPFK